MENKKYLDLDKVVEKQDNAKDPKQLDYIKGTNTPLDQQLAKAMYDNKDLMLNLDNVGNEQIVGKVNYKSKGKNGFKLDFTFKDMHLKGNKQLPSQDDIKEAKSKDITLKVEDELKQYDVFEYRLLKVFTKIIREQDFNPNIIISLNDLATKLRTNKDYLRKNLKDALNSFGNVRIDYNIKFNYKDENGKPRHVLEGVIYSVLNDYKILDNEICNLNFNKDYIFIESLYKITQYEPLLFTLNANSYQYASFIIGYIDELARYHLDNNGKVKDFTIKQNSIYDNVKKIPRIEKIRKMKASTTQKIYEPYERNRKFINENANFTLEYVDENGEPFKELYNKDTETTDLQLPFYDANYNFIFENWLNTNVKVHFKEGLEPIYGENINKSREHYKKIADKIKRDTNLKNKVAELENEIKGLKADKENKK